MFNELDKIVNSVPLDQQALAAWALDFYGNMTDETYGVST